MPDLTGDTKSFGAIPRGVDWGVTLGAAIMRTLEAQQPGFRDMVKADLANKATDMEQSGDEDRRADAPSVRELIESWVFTT